MSFVILVAALLASVAAATEGTPNKNKAPTKVRIKSNESNECKMID